MTLGLDVRNGGAAWPQARAAGGKSVRLWVFATGGECQQAALASLDEDERLRAGRLLRPADRAAFVATRAALRRILAAELGTRAEQVRLTQNSWGKPRLAGADAEVLDFSVSHTRGLSAIAVSDGRAIGVDIERVRAVPDRIRIAAATFGDDVARHLQSVPVEQQTVLFLQLWTAAEAWVKALGLGLAGVGGRVPVRLAGSLSPTVQLGADETPAGDWRLVPLLMPSGFVGNVVVGRSPRQGAESARSTTILLAGGR